MNEIVDPGNVMGAVMGAGGLLGGLLYVRRQLSRDKSEIVKDRAEDGMLGKALARADAAESDAQNVRAQRTADASKIAHLESDLAYAQRENTRLMKEIKRAVRGLPKESRDFLETNFSMLADVDLDDGTK